MRYRHDRALDLWLPASMSERYRLLSESIDCHAEYSGFRRFGVATDVSIGAPAGNAKP